MKAHIDNLIFLVPDLLSRHIVGVGSGKGFLLELARHDVAYKSTHRYPNE